VERNNSKRSNFEPIVKFTQILILELSNCDMVQEILRVMLLDSLQ
jgi:hypothetical protein